VVVSPNSLRGIRYSDVMPIDHFPAFPAVEHQQQDGEEGNPKSPRKDAGRGTEFVSDEPVDEHQYDSNEIADQMLPGITDVANTSVTESIKPKSAATSAMIMPAPRSHIEAVAQIA
jgi:hypothetical protein